MSDKNGPDSSTVTSPTEPSPQTGTPAGGRGVSTTSSSRRNVVEFKPTLANIEGVMASLPPSLTRLIDVETDGWTKPLDLTMEQVLSSRAWLPRAEALLKPADRKLIEKWLIHLGVLCAGQISTEDAKAKVMAYAELMDAPASVLNKRTLADAGRAFKWFPSFAEVSEFLDGRTWVMRKLAARLKLLSETTPQLEHHQGSDYNTLTQEQKDELDRKLAQAKDLLTSVSRTLG